MKEKVYIETSVVSYYTARPSGDLIAAARQKLTHDWWQSRSQYAIYASKLVLLEASRGNQEAARQRLAALAGMPLLEINIAAQELADELVSVRLVPEKCVEDALHMALAAVHRVDFLLTWNCKHIANAHIRPRLTRTLENAGYSCPIICTPEELLGDDSHD